MAYVMERGSMKAIGGILTLAALGASIVFFNAHRSAAVPASLAPAATADPARLDLVSRQLADVQRSLAAVEAKLAAAHQESAAASTRAADSQPQPTPSPEDVEAARAVEAEQHHLYVSTVAQSFGAERNDPGWAAHVSTQIVAGLDADETLRDMPHDVQCRRETCRVQIDDDGSGKLSRALPQFVHSLGPVLPTVVAERVVQGNGKGAMVLYMSTHERLPTLPPASK